MSTIKFARLVSLYLLSTMMLGKVVLVRPELDLELWTSTYVNSWVVRYGTNEIRGMMDIPLDSTV